MCAIFRQLLRCNADVKHLTLMWIGDCFHANAGRGKLWTAEMGGVLSGSFVSDGFMLNLGSILMKLCSPFTEGHHNPKLLKIDCRYVGTSCVVSEDSRLKNMHLRNAEQETCLLPRPKDPGPELECAVGEPFNFITDLFFLTHKCLDLGFRVAQEKFVKLNQHLNRQQQLYREAETGADRALAEQIQQRMDSAMTRYLSLKAALLEPETLKLMMQLSATTCTFLVHSALQENIAIGKDEALATLDFPLPDHVSPRLYYIPEFLIENICEHVLLARRFWPHHFEENGEHCLGSLMDFVLCFMASPQWVRNPHLRARMAECLEVRNKL
jgi:ubiquitin conjugation factor E4 A